MKLTRKQARQRYENVSPNTTFDTWLLINNVILMDDGYSESSLSSSSCYSSSYDSSSSYSSDSSSSCSSGD